jgi:hypothetical protein
LSFKGAHKVVNKFELSISRPTEVGPKAMCDIIGISAKNNNAKLSTEFK